jgi:hypothetical protein
MRHNYDVIRSTSLALSHTHASRGNPCTSATSHTSALGFLFRQVRRGAGGV